MRASTGDVPRGTRVPASAFTPVPGQAQPVDGQPALCTACGVPLAFRWLPAPGSNGASEHVPETASLHNSPRQVTSGSAVVTTLFHVEPSEEVLHMAPAGKDKFLIITNRRAVVLDVTAVAEEP